MAQRLTYIKIKCIEKNRKLRELWERLNEIRPEISYSRFSKIIAGLENCPTGFEMDCLKVFGAWGKAEQLERRRVGL